MIRFLWGIAFLVGCGVQQPSSLEDRIDPPDLMGELLYKAPSDVTLPDGKLEKNFYVFDSLRMERHSNTQFMIAKCSKMNEYRKAQLGEIVKLPEGCYNIELNNSTYQQFQITRGKRTTLEAKRIEVSDPGRFESPHDWQLYEYKEKAKSKLGRLCFASAKIGTGHNVTSGRYVVAVRYQDHVKHYEVNL